MAADWQKLLGILRVTDREVIDTVERAYRKRLGKDATEEGLIETCNEIYVKMLIKLTEDPSYFAFQSAKNLLGTIYTSTWRVLSHGFRDTNRRRKAFSVLEETQDSFVRSREVEEIEWEHLRELFADCNTIINDYLSDVDPEIREVFRLRCEEMKPGDIAIRLGLKPSTALRRWNDAKEILLEKFRGKLPGNLGKE